MAFPEFFAQVPRITLQDPLADFLGAAADGLIEYSYADAVRLAGHSCPTVAGAYLLTCRSLERLFGAAVPQRGGVAVACDDSLESGVTGVIASVIGLLTGAAAGGGFQGLAGRYSRRNLLQFGAGGQGSFRFQRLDSGTEIRARLNLGPVPADLRMGPLLQELLTGSDDPAVATEFRQLWQDRVRRILLEHWNDPDVLQFA